MTYLLDWSLDHPLQNKVGMKTKTLSLNFRNSKLSANNKSADPKTARQLERGQSLMEYLILTSLLAIGSIGIVRVISKNMGARFSSVAEALNGNERTYQGENVQNHHYNKKTLSTFMRDAGQGNSGN